MKNKATILPGLMLFASFVILMVCGMGFDFVFSRFPSLGIVLIAKAMYRTLTSNVRYIG